MTTSLDWQTLTVDSGVTRDEVQRAVDGAQILGVVEVLSAADTGGWNILLFYPNDNFDEITAYIRSQLPVRVRTLMEIEREAFENGTANIVGG